MEDSRYGYWFIAPCIVLIVLVLGFPMLMVLGLSFAEYRPMVSLEWAGLDNYVSVMKDPVFMVAVKNTFVFTICSVLFHTLLGLAAALLLNRAFKGRVVVRVLFLLPWMLSYIVGAITWKWMLNGSYGILNEVLMRVHLIDSYQAWLGNPSTAMFFLIVASVWKQFPYDMLMFTAGLQSISQEQYEAASIDGAGAIHKFFYVTLPNMKNIIIVTSTLDFIWSFKQFDLIYVMTGGGPGTSTEVLSTLIRNTFFNAFNFGKASAMAIFLLVIVMVISFFYARLIFGKPAERT